MSVICAACKQPEPDHSMTCAFNDKRTYVEFGPAADHEWGEDYCAQIGCRLTRGQHPWRVTGQERGRAEPVSAVSELPVRIPTSRRGRVVVKLRDDAYTLRLMRAATGDHECRPFETLTENMVPIDEQLAPVLTPVTDSARADVPRETSPIGDTGSGAK